jgi:hypothetical protein
MILNESTPLYTLINILFTSRYSYGDLLNPEDESIRNTLHIQQQLSPAGKRALNSIALDIKKLEEG